MAEQPNAAPADSFGTTCRAIVMLLCLIALPLLALRGTTLSDLTRTLPQTVKNEIDRRLGTNLAVAKETLPEAPRFEPDARTTSPSTGLDARPPASAALSRANPMWADESQPPRSMPAAPSHVSRPAPRTLAENATPNWQDRQETASMPRRARAAADTASADASFGAARRPGFTGPESQPRDEVAQAAMVEPQEPEGPRYRGDSRAASLDPGDGRRMPLVPVARRERNWANTSYTESPPLQNAVIRPDGRGPAGGDPPDRFTYVADRLRELGAVYYLLETWSNDRYRFHCRMAIGGNPSYTRYFEATDRDPMQAMGKVLSDVETWRAGR